MSTQSVTNHIQQLRPRVIALGLLAVLSALPLKTNPIRVVALSEPLTIQTRKSEPPRIAFDQSIIEKKQVAWMPESGFEKLNSGPPEKIRIQIQPMVISRLESDVVREIAAVESATQRSDIYRNLTPAQANRLAMAEEKADVLSQNWREPTWKDVVRKEIAELKNTNPTVVRPTGKNVVRGQILLTGGLPNPNVSNTSVVVRRESEGVSKEYGQANTVDATYAIQVGEMDGYLIAEMYDKNRNLLGEGRARLSKFASGGPQLVVRAIQSNNSMSFYDYEREREQGKDSIRRRTRTSASQTVARAGNTRVASNTLGTQGLTNEDGDFNPGRVATNSWFMARTQSEGRAQSLFMLNAGDDHHLPSFQNEFVQSVLEIIQQQFSTRLDLAAGGLIWGRVTQDSKPFMGATVEVENQPDAIVVYLNELMIPDVNMKVTTSNGYFVAVNLQPGWASLISRLGHAHHSYTNVVVDQNAISPAVLTSKLAKEDVPVRVYDGLTGAPESATLVAQNLETELYVDGLSQVQLPNVRRQALVHVRPTNEIYSDFQTVHSDHLDYWHIPLVKKEWILQLRASQEISDSPETGVIVGFSPNDDFEAFLPNEEGYESRNIVYFDSHGLVTDRGVIGGGFVMFNVPPGVQSVTLVNRQDVMASQVVPVDPTSLSVFKFVF